MQPSSVERIIRRAIRHSISTGERAEHRRQNRQPNGRQPEDLLAERDHPLADRRVHDVRRLAGEHVRVAGEDQVVGVARPVLCS